MKRDVVKLIANSFFDWYYYWLPPAGKPTVHSLRARTLNVLDKVPCDTECSVNLDNLTEENVTMALEWMFSLLATTYADDAWAPCCIHALRLLALDNIDDIYSTIVSRPGV